VDNAAKHARNKVRQQKASKMKATLRDEGSAPGEDAFPDDDGDVDVDESSDDEDDDNDDDSLSTSSKSSSNSSSSVEEREQDVSEIKQPKGGVDLPQNPWNHNPFWPPKQTLGSLGLVAAKMSVRTGVRCWCCYSNVCRNLKN